MGLRTGAAGSSPSADYQQYLLVLCLRASYALSAFTVIIFQLGKANGQVLFYPPLMDERKLGLSLERLISNDSKVGYLLSVKS